MQQHYQDIAVHVAVTHISLEPTISCFNMTDFTTDFVCGIINISQIAHEHLPTLD